MNKDLDQLIHLAISLGASKAHIISSDKIVVEDQLSWVAGLVMVG